MQHGSIDPEAPWPDWFAFGASLELAPGVHAPSRFSALLASTMRDSAGRSVIDAGCGAGLITIAALVAGAREVHAIDLDPAAVEVTRANVVRLLGADALDRLSTRVLDFTRLDEIEADLLAVNPPQRPTRLLEAVEPDQRHLHEGGGPDGLDTLRLVLAHASARTVRTTAAQVLDVAAARSATATWAPPSLVTRAELPMHHAWTPLSGPVGTVGVWDFPRASVVRREAGTA